MSIDHCSGCCACDRVVVGSQHAGVGSCRRHVATGGLVVPLKVVTMSLHTAVTSLSLEVMAILFAGVAFL